MQNDSRSMETVFLNEQLEIKPILNTPINGLQEISDFIFTSKYANFNKKFKRRETLFEAVDFIRDMHLEKYDFLSKEDKDKIIWSFNFVKQKIVVPSMRSMQFRAPAITQHNAKIYNCLARETEFITSIGVKSFNDFEDGDIITVLTDKGNWKKAVVRNFGKQNLFPITIKRVKSEKIVWATKNHTWIKKDDERTESLKDGDILKGAPNIFEEFNYDNASIPEKLYWCYGYVFGDGTKVKSNSEYKYSMVRLCKNDNQYLDRFTEMGFKYSFPPSKSGDAVVYTGSYLKESPDPKNTSLELLKAFSAGYLDADGKKDKNSQTRKFSYIQSSEKDHIDFIRNVFPIVGQYIVSEEDLTGEKTNFGIRPYTIKFCINSSFNHELNNNNPFIVNEIGDETRYEDVWCLEVEDDHSFVLPFGLVTGNCGVRHIDSLRAFAEFFYCLLCGTGMTAGLTHQVISLLPELANEKDKTGSVITYTIEDTIEGWADSLEILLMSYHKNTPFTGRKVIFDYSKIRKKGTPLKTSGGKAPGFEGLKNSHIKIKQILDHAIEHLKLNQLRSIDIYDILMHCADAVLSGGIRRAATAVIFDQNDEHMLNAKINFVVSSYKRFEQLSSGYWEGTVYVNKKKYEVTVSDWEYQNDIKINSEISWIHIEPQRARSNNSVLLLRDKITLAEFLAIVERSRKYGEPGFVFANDSLSLFNPCFEISFIPKTKDGRFGVQFCNLSSINGAKINSLEKWKEAVEAATIIGTLQAGYTNFKYLSKAATELTEDEALLGVSLTGWFDNPEILLNEQNQYMISKLAVKINKQWAKKLGIKQAARVTCVKPEGTSSLFLEASSGIHPHHAKRYFRRVQMNKLDNVYQYFKMFNPHATEESIWSATKTDDIITFPLVINDKAIVKDDITAIEHLNYVRQVQENWVNPGTTEANTKNVTHNVSVTVECEENEFEDVTKYLFENRQYFAAVSLLPKIGDKLYKQAPLQRVYVENEEEWSNLTSNWSKVDYTKLIEEEDNTSLVENLACAGGACDVTYLPVDKKAS